MVPLVGNSGHLLFGHAVYRHHMSPQVAHCTEHLVAAGTPSLATVLLHVFDQVGALRVADSANLTRSRAICGEGWC